MNLYQIIVLVYLIVSYGYIGITVWFQKEEDIDLFIDCFAFGLSPLSFLVIILSSGLYKEQKKLI